MTAKSITTTGRRRWRRRFDDLQTQVSFDPSRIRYDGTLGYRQGRVTFGDFNPLQHDFQARFNVAPSGLTLSPIVLASAPLRVTADARHAGLRQILPWMAPTRPLSPAVSWGSF